VMVPHLPLRRSISSRRNVMCVVWGRLLVARGELPLHCLRSRETH